MMPRLFSASCFILLLFGCGPGVSDGEWHISSGYYFSDAGHIETMIVKRDGDKLAQIVIDAQVNGWVLNGSKILVSRSPRLIYEKNNIAYSKLSDGVEYFEIDIKTHQILGPYSDFKAISTASLSADELNNLIFRRP